MLCSEDCYVQKYPKGISFSSIYLSQCIDDKQSIHKYMSVESLKILLPAL